ncbi:MAG: hydrolase [Planctomycetaceae bacterium]|jgi:nicotinamidase-related amidase|nr:hydrolase [Planctomycetaceae bacterium]
MYQRSFSILSPENSLLFVVDIQERLMPVINKSSTVIFNTRRLLNSAQLLGIPVIVSEQYPKGLGNTVTEIAQAIPKTTPVIAKQSFSVCAVEEVRKELEKYPAPKIILCGVETHVCILQSTFDLLTMGKDVVLAVDAVGSRFPIDEEIALRRLESSGVTLATTESVMFEWCGTSEHPHFKTISRFAKEQAESRLPEHSESIK